IPLGATCAERVAAILIDLERHGSVEARCFQAIVDAPGAREQAYYSRIAHGLVQHLTHDLAGMQGPSQRSAPCGAGRRPKLLPMLQVAMVSHANRGVATDL